MEVKSSLLSTVQENLRQRKWGAAVRLEISAKAEEGFLAQLKTGSALDLEDRDIYRVAGPVDLTALAALCRIEGFRELKEQPFEPQLPAQFVSRGNVFDAIREGDILVHHPYESFGAVIEFIEQAADDPNVLAIKQTLYRTADDNPIISALARAAENGKQVLALVELQARLDEENNIVKARALQKAGVHVVYGMVGLKTHCKAALVVRREHDGIRRYVHLGTGNYNPTTARIYTDLSYFTCRPEFGDDASSLFNLLSGYSQGYAWKKLTVAPANLADRLIALIDRERRHAEAGEPARIIAKMNALVDPTAITALCSASRAGVKIDLIIQAPASGSSACRGSPTTSGSSASSTSSWSTRGSPTPERRGPRSTSPPPTGCRATSAASRSCSRVTQNRVVEGILGVALMDNGQGLLPQPDATYRRCPAARLGAIDSLAGRVPEHGPRTLHRRPDAPDERVGDGRDAPRLIRGIYERRSLATVHPPRRHDPRGLGRRGTLARRSCAERTGGWPPGSGWS